jgi:hypothetical protein
VSSITTGDVNDADILNKTRQETGQNNAVKFFYTLPSGKTMNSEWIAEDQRKPALLLWLDAMRSAIVEDVKDIQRKKVGTGPKKPVPGQSDDDTPLPSAVVGMLAVPAGTIGRTVTPSTDSGNVELYLTSKLESARHRKDIAIGALESAQAEYNEATAELAKIRKLIAALAAED